MATSSFHFTHSSILLNVSQWKIGIARALWNHDITSILFEGAIEGFKDAGINLTQILHFEVPGAFELPLASQKLFEDGCDAVVNLGCVVRGDTPHFEYVCMAATNGILDVGLKFSKPNIFGVLTTENFAQAQDRAGGKLGNKGREAAETAIALLSQFNIQKK